MRIQIPERLPWHIRDGAEEGEYHVCTSGRTIAVCDARPPDECKVNSDYIIHACNQYPKLVAACKEAARLYDHLAMGTIEGAAKYGPDYEPPSDDEWLAFREMLEDALKSAGEKSDNV